MTRARRMARYLKVYKLYDEYLSYIEDILEHPDVQRMAMFSHHGDTNTLQHSMNVSYYSFLIAKKFNFDARSLARGGMLHDFFLYDWHDHEGPKLAHTYNHPKQALANAEARFDLNDVEREIILKHMYPAVENKQDVPKFAETRIIAFVDKVVCCAEVARVCQKLVERRLLNVERGDVILNGPKPALVRQTH